MDAKSITCLLIEIHGADMHPEESRYSPAGVISCRAVDISGKPDPKHISTSDVERQNLTMRMHNAPVHLFTNAFSKKLEHHIAAISLPSCITTLLAVAGVTWRVWWIAAGVSDRVWEIGLLERRVGAKAELGEEQKIAFREGARARFLMRMWIYLFKTDSNLDVTVIELIKNKGALMSDTKQPQILVIFK